MNTPFGRSKRAFTLSALAVAALAFVSPDGHAAPTEQASYQADLLLFCADWSPSCEHDQKLFEQELPEALKRANLNVRVKVIDADVNPALLKHYKVEYVPAVFVKTPDRKVYEFLDERVEPLIVDFTKEQLER